MHSTTSKHKQATLKHQASAKSFSFHEIILLHSSLAPNIAIHRPTQSTENKTVIWTVISFTRNSDLDSRTAIWRDGSCAPRNIVSLPSPNSTGGPAPADKMARTCVWQVHKEGIVLRQSAYQSQRLGYQSDQGEG
jgi:hypothetical protein